MKTLIKTMVFLLAVTLATTARAGGQRTFTVNGVSFTMVNVEGGTFTMGATAEQGSDYESDERPTHQVTLSDFMIGQTEVTEALWTAVMGSNPSYNKKGDNYPVEGVSWDDCQTFITKLNQLTGETFRLPTEAEWEFAARGGNYSKGYMYAGSNNLYDVGWFENNSGYAKHFVATKQPNELNLYDMSGNVWEWCQDYYGNYSDEPQTNPTGPSLGTNRIFRGGCWKWGDGCSRVAQRGGEGDFYPSSNSDVVGLRIAWSKPAGMTFTVNGVSFTMVNVEGGTFTMGGEYSNSNWTSGLPTHQVTLSSFSIGQTEVTQALYEAVMGNNPSYHTGDSQYPVERVTWGMCQEFITKLNQLTGQKFRLPTEAEWEFAARGGNKSQGFAYSGSDNADEVSWNRNNSGRVSHPVGTKLPNELGIYDMTGNVWERLADWYGSYSSEAQVNPTGPQNGSRRCTRGSGYGDQINGDPYGPYPLIYRGRNYESDQNNDMGFRIVLSNYDEIIATGLSLDKSSLSLVVGSGATLTATVIPDNASNKKLNWSSSNPSVASVDANGNVVANDEGSAIITVSTTDGSDLSASCTVECQFGDTRTVLVGTGNRTGNEGAPICNWWMTGYQGNECLYTKDELKMKKGDIITSLSYHCIGGSASGGKFNVRLLNTSLSELADADSSDPSILKVKYEDTVYGTVQLGGYSSGDWVTFNLTKPFVYDGENIIVDIRNVEKGSRSGWVYFESSTTDRKQLTWRNALNEAVTGFDSSYSDRGIWAGGDIRVSVLITYAPNAVDYVYATELSLDKTETFLAINDTEQLLATIEPENVTTKSLQWTSSNPTVATVDGAGKVKALSRGTAVITATTTDGSELSASCTVVVTSIYALLTDTLKHVRGDAATVVDLPIVMVNKNDISGLQFELTLPDGVSMVTTNGQPAVSLDENRKSRDHVVYVTHLNNGNYRVLVSSPTNKRLKGNNGVVLHINLELARYHNSGDKNLLFSNIKFAEPDETQHPIENFTSIARLCYVMGDADADTQVDVGDYMATVLSIMERPVARFYADAANVNNDSEVDITDLIGITNIALGIRTPEIRYASAMGKTFEPEMSLELADDCYDILLSNSRPVAGIQFDVLLPEGMRIEDTMTMGRADKWQLTAADLGNSVTRVLLTRFGDEDIEIGDDAVIRLMLNGDMSGLGECKVDNIAIVQRDLTTFHPAPLGVTITGIKDLRDNGAVKIYAKDGNVIIDSGEDGMAQLVILNGMTRPLTVKAGHNIYPVNNNGIYIVRFNGVTAKLKL